MPTKIVEKSMPTISASYEFLARVKGLATGTTANIENTLIVGKAREINEDGRQAPASPTHELIVTGGLLDDETRGHFCPLNSARIASALSACLGRRTSRCKAYP